MTAPAQDTAPVISVILCTRNRAAQLGATLEAYARLRCPVAWEMIIVDSSSDDTPAVVQRFAAAHGLPVILLHEPRRGLAVARNTGLARARGSLICFSDDDCYPAPDWLEAWLAVFADPSLDYAGGRIELFDPTDANVTIKTETEPEVLPERSYIPAGALHGANLAFRRATLARIGGFDARFGATGPYRSAEDSEIVQRASLAGLRGAYRPEPWVAHHHGRKPEHVPALLRIYEYGRGALYARVMLQSPSCLPRAVWAEFRRQGSVLAFLKQVYWANRHHFLVTKFTVTRGILHYVRDAILRRDPGAPALPITPT
jgi:glycosyltransferase involved in cell wall biosynthesis